MRRALGALMVLFAVTASAQSGREVTGAVMDATTHEAIPFAKVVIRSFEAGGATPTTVLSDGSGKFAVEGVPPGNYGLQASQAAYAPSPYTQLLVSKEVDPASTTILLTGMAVVYGRVTDASGRGRPETMITTVQRLISGGKPVYKPASTGITNDLGEYRIGGLTAGTYAICAGLQERRAEQLRKLAYAPDCGAGGAENPQWFVLGPGKELPVDFHLVPQKGGLVEGIVVGGTANSPVAVMELLDGGFPAPRGYQVRFAPDHVHFTVDDLPPGRYRIFAFGPDQNSHALQDVDVGTDDLQIRLEIRPVPVLRVSLLHPPEMVSTARFRNTAGEFVNGQVGLVDAVAENGSARISAAHAGDDMWEMRFIAPGDYEISAQIPAGGLNTHPLPVYVARVAQGGRELPGGIVHVDASTDPEPAEITLAYGGGTIHVVCSCTRGQSPVFTLLRRVGAKMQQLALSAVPRATDHEWEYTGVPPGDYMLLAWPKDSNVEYLNPEVLKKYDDARVNVSVADGQTMRVNIDVVRMDQAGNR